MAGLALHWSNGQVEGQVNRANSVSSNDRLSLQKVRRELTRERRMPQVNRSRWEVARLLYYTMEGSVRLELTIDRTFITIHGADRTGVLQTAQALQKLN